MPKFRLSRPAVLVMALFLMLAMALPALADQPEIEGPSEWTNVETVYCPTYGYEYILEIRTDITARSILYLDEYGELLSSRTHLRGQDTVTNLSSGLVATGNFSIVMSDSWDSNLEVVNGVDWMLRVPGRGMVFQEAGRIILDYGNYPGEIVFQAGRHEIIGGYPGMCAAMSS